MYDGAFLSKNPVNYFDIKAPSCQFPVVSLRSSNGRSQGGNAFNTRREVKFSQQINTRLKLVAVITV